MSDFTSYLKRLRGKISMRQVAKSTGLSNAYLSQLESGKRDNPHPEVLKELAAFFNVPMIEMLKAAGYLKDDDMPEESYDAKINRLFNHVINDPGYKYGHRIKGAVTTEVKKFVIEMYEKATGKTLL